MGNRRIRQLRAAALAVVIAAPCMSWETAEADSYRCGRKLIRTGDSAADVLRVCGQPLFKDRGEATLKLDGAAKRISVQRWHYKQSRRSLQHMVLIHKGQVVAIETGGR